MGIKATPRAFASEEEAAAAFERDGCAVLVGDFPANELDLHWHSFEYHTYVVEGSVLITDADGVEYDCQAGTLLEIPYQALHAETNTAGRFLFGFPAGEIPDITVNRDPNEHPDRDHRDDAAQL